MCAHRMRLTSEAVAGLDSGKGGRVMRFRRVLGLTVLVAACVVAVVYAEFTAAFVLLLVGAAVLGSASRADLR